jgi:hypothetical protein
VFSVFPGTYHSDMHHSVFWQNECLNEQSELKLTSNSQCNDKTSAWIRISKFKHESKVFSLLGTCTIPICSMYHRLQSDLLASLQNSWHIIDGFAMMPVKQWQCDDPIAIRVCKCCFCGPTEPSRPELSSTEPCRAFYVPAPAHLGECARWKIQQYHIACVSLWYFT